jgi:hypothetical protein
MGELASPTRRHATGGGLRKGAGERAHHHIRATQNNGCPRMGRMGVNICQPDLCGATLWKSMA